MENNVNASKSKPYIDANGVTVERAQQQAPGPAPRMSLTPVLVARQQREIAQRLAPVMAAILGRDNLDSAESDALSAAVEAFYALYRQSPLVDNKGGSQFNDGLSLFVTARLFGPEQLIESGTHRGFSSWLLRHACPSADIQSFDIDHRELSLRAEKVAYHECDWLDRDVHAKRPDKALIFFDDHISHARRLLEAQARGFRHLLFDDNFPVTALYATGGVPVPTIAMLMDDSLMGGEELSWTRNNKIYRYRLDGDILRRARRFIRRSVVLPDVTDLTEYASPSRMTYVELVKSNDNI